MRHGALVEAALLDQERRVLASLPGELDGGRRECRRCGGKLGGHNRSGLCSQRECLRQRTKEIRAQHKASRPPPPPPEPEPVPTEPIIGAAAGPLGGLRDYCRGGCMRWAAFGRGEGGYTCHPCRRLKRKAAENDGRPRCPKCARRLLYDRYCTNGACTAKG